MKLISIVLILLYFAIPFDRANADSVKTKIAVLDFQ